MADTPSNTAPAEAAAPSSTETSTAPKRPDLTKRALAAIIDAVIAMVVGLVPFAGGIAATAYWLVRDGMDLDFMDHRSIGKKVMKLRPVTLDGRPLDLATSVKRNWMFGLGGLTQFFAMTIIGLVLAVPLGLIAFVIGIVEVVLVITDAEGRRMGDKMAGTRVIETDS